MRRFLAVALAVTALVATAAVVWMYRTGAVKPFFQRAAGHAPKAPLVDRLHSQNPRIAGEAEQEVLLRGDAVLPEIHAVLKDPAAEPAKKKAALRACALLAQLAAPALRDVAAHLGTPEYAAEAAMALSLMGPDAFAPLTDALRSPHADVRKESIRSLGKLHERAPLDATYIVPPLLESLADPDPGVRMLACTYLGIIHEYPDAAVPALAEMLMDEDPEVRTAAATALGSFGAAAGPALPALRRAQGDKDENVAREAGLALVKLQETKDP